MGPRPITAVVSNPRRPSCIPDLSRPPLEALEAVQTAAEQCERLLGQGCEVRFRRTPMGLRVELCSLTGELIRELTPSEALALAAAEISRG